MPWAVNLLVILRTEETGTLRSLEIVRVFHTFVLLNPQTTLYTSFLFSVLSVDTQHKVESTFLHFNWLQVWLLYFPHLLLATGVSNTNYRTIPCLKSSYFLQFWQGAIFEFFVKFYQVWLFFVFLCVVAVQTKTIACEYQNICNWNNFLREVLHFLTELQGYRDCVYIFTVLHKFFLPAAVVLLCLFFRACLIWVILMTVVVTADCNIAICISFLRSPFKQCLCRLHWFWPCQSSFAACLRLCSCMLFLYMLTNSNIFYAHASCLYSKIEYVI